MPGRTASLSGSAREGGVRIRITITTAGSRGDVQPCVALGLGLRDAGYRVTVAAWAPFRRLIEDSGLPFHPVAGPDPDRLVAALSEAGNKPWKYAKRFRSLLCPHATQGFHDCLAACRNADAIVYTPLGFAGSMVAEHLETPAIGAVVEPLFVRTGRYPSAMLGRPPGGSALIEPPLPRKLYNHLTHRAVEQLYWRTVEPLVRDLRSEVGLPPMPSLLGPLGGMHRGRSPMLLGWSKHVLPESPEREAWMRTTGYWFLDQTNWRPPARLREFLYAGEPPVSLGLGSMTGIASVQTDRIFDLTVRALDQAGKRGVLLGSSGGRAGLPDSTIDIAGGVPYSWLFRRVAVAVHHGGAGTTAEALRAGVPSVVIPLGPDQAFWGSRVASLGAGPSPIPPRRLTIRRLAAAILRAANDAGMHERCKELGRQISAEDGVGKAVETLREHVGNSGLQKERTRGN